MAYSLTELCVCVLVAGITGVTYKFTLSKYDSLGRASASALTALLTRYSCSRLHVSPRQHRAWRSTRWWVASTYPTRACASFTKMRPRAFACTHCVAALTHRQQVLALVSPLEVFIHLFAIGPVVASLKGAATPPFRHDRAVHCLENVRRIRRHNHQLSCAVLALNVAAVLSGCHTYQALEDHIELLCPVHIARTKSAWLTDQHIESEAAELYVMDLAACI